jgi:ribosomal protein L13
MGRHSDASPRASRTSCWANTKPCLRRVSNWVTATGTKTKSKMVTKMYHRHSNYPGGYKSISLRDQLQQHPDRVLRAAVWGMLPHNRMGRSIIKRLKIYAGPDHPHGTNNPVPLAPAKA